MIEVVVRVQVRGIQSAGDGQLLADVNRRKIVGFSFDIFIQAKANHVGKNKRIMIKITFVSLRYSILRGGVAVPATEGVLGSYLCSCIQSSGDTADDRWK